MKSRLFQSFGHVGMVVHAGVALRYALQVHLILIMFSARAVLQLGTRPPRWREEPCRQQLSGGQCHSRSPSVRLCDFFYACGTGNARRRGLVRLLDS